MIKKRRIFIDPINNQIKWLNGMAKKGYRLVDVKGFTYNFEECKEEYIYNVEFVAHKSKKEIDKYMNLLSELNINTFIKKINIGKRSIGNYRWRTYGKNSMKIVPTGLELLILEKRNDGNPFELFTEADDRIVYYRIIRNAFSLPVPFLLIGTLYGNPRLSLLGKDYSNFIPNIMINYLGIFICILFALVAIKYTFLIRREKSSIL